MNRIQQAYDPESFRALGHRFVDAMADHLGAMQRREGPVLPWREPSEALEAWPADFTAAGGEDPLLLAARFMKESQHLQHPRFVGHQCTAPLPLTALLGGLRDLLNNGCAVYEMGPVGTAMERAVVQWLLGRCGFGQGDGVLTHGGSAGNLTALLAARQGAADWDVWEEGNRQDALVVLVSDQAHYSVRRSAQVLGLGGRSVIPVATDGACRMRMDALDEALARVEAEGRRVMAVVACAGSTATGSIDPLAAIADRCEARGIWMHVDGAHSGALVASERLRARLAGLERADSVVIDFHKMMLVPSLATAVLFRNGEHSFETFSQQASYLFDRSARQEWYNLAQRTLECTKRSLGLELYGLLKVYGTGLLESYLDAVHDLAADFYNTLCVRPNWECAVAPEGNIVCFRHIPEGVGDMDALQERLREGVVQEGCFYVVKTRLFGKTWLRTSLMNPLTTVEDLQALLERMEALARHWREA